MHMIMSFTCSIPLSNQGFISISGNLCCIRNSFPISLLHISNPVLLVGFLVVEGSVGYIGTRTHRNQEPPTQMGIKDINACSLEGLYQPEKTLNPGSCILLMKDLWDKV